jgi:methionyl-tRNA synthetase
VAQLEPWRPSADRDAVQRAQYMALETLRISSCLLAPSMPDRMAALQASLQLGADETTWQSCLALRPEVRVERSDAKVAPLFPPLPEPVQVQKPQLSSAQRKKLKQQERRQRQAQ